MSQYTEICPSCTKEEGHLMGTGPDFALYYNCYSCGHHFIVDGTQYINENNEIENEEDIQPITSKGD